MAGGGLSEPRQYPSGADLQHVAQNHSQTIARSPTTLSSDSYLTPTRSPALSHARPAEHNENLAIIPPVLAETEVSMSEEDQEDVDDVPLHRMKPFGSGLRRNEIKFVPASNEKPTVVTKTSGKPSGQSISDFYLKMVLKDSATQTSSEADEPETEVCEICQLPLSSTPATSADFSNGKPNHHDASIAHQVCLTHSHPPSALDRKRVGLSIMEAAGWDPDSRRGLGAEGQGVQYPIKVKPKEDKLGVGVVVPKDFAKREKEKPKLLDAKKVRKLAVEDRKKTDKLQQNIFGKLDLEQYLGKGA